MSEHKVSRNCPVCEAPLGANDGDYCQSCTYEPDAVEEANALAQVTRERADLESALADEKRTIERLIRERDEVRRERDELQKRGAEREAERDVAIANRELAEDEAKYLRADLEEARKDRALLTELAKILHEPGKPDVIDGESIVCRVVSLHARNGWVNRALNAAGVGENFGRVDDRINYLTKQRDESSRRLVAAGAKLQDIHDAATASPELLSDITNQDLVVQEVLELRRISDKQLADAQERIQALVDERDAVVEAFSKYATLRDQVAMHVLQGLIVAGRYTDYGFQVKMASVSGDRYVGCDLETVVRDSLLVADTFIKERSK